MNRFAIPFPVAPGRTDADARSIAEYFKAHMVEYRASRKRLGVSLERAYLQHSPMGAVVVAYVETDKQFGEWMAALVSSDLDIDKRFIAMVAHIHGVDLRQPPPGPPPETLGVWVDPNVTVRRKGFAFVAPVAPGKEEAGRQFSRIAFADRVAELAESRRAIAENVEVVTLTATPMGSMICVYLEGSDPVAGNAAFAASTRPYDVWFKNQLKEIFPPTIDFNEPVPANEELFDSLA